MQKKEWRMITLLSETVNVSEIVKKIRHSRNSYPDLQLQNVVVLTSLLTFMFEQIALPVFLTEKKIKTTQPNKEFFLLFLNAAKNVD